MNSEQWQEYPLALQLGNLGSEVGRMVSLKKKGDTLHTEKAFERALELLDMIIADAGKKKSVGELTRLREVLCGFINNSPEYKITGEQINNYFIPFALMARK